MGRNIDCVEHLFPEIFSRVQVIDLIRLSCVSKDWNQFIKSPDFISQHHRTFNNLTQPIHLLVRRISAYFHSNFDEPLFSHIYLLSFNLDTENMTLDEFDLDFNHDRFTCIDILGPCNGLYCLSCSPFQLINPSMRALRTLPHAPDPYVASTVDRFHGFGFDPETNDYKVVSIMCTYDEETGKALPWHVEVYSLSVDSWKAVECRVSPSVYIWHNSRIDAFVLGEYHWWADDDVGSVVVAFNMASETFRVIRVPQDVTARSEFGLESIFEHVTATVAKFGESLAVIAYPYWGFTEKKFNLWVMEDYKDGGTWIKRYSIGPILGAKQPMGLLKERDLFLVEDRDGMLFYNLKTGEIKRGLYSEADRKESFQAAVFTESLVPLPRADGKLRSLGVKSFLTWFDALLLRGHSS